MSDDPGDVRFTISVIRIGHGEDCSLTLLSGSVRTETTRPFDTRRRCELNWCRGTRAVVTSVRGNGDRYTSDRTIVRLGRRETSFGPTLPVTVDGLTDPDVVWFQGDTGDRRPVRGKLVVTSRGDIGPCFSRVVIGVSICSHSGPTLRRQHVLVTSQDVRDDVGIHPTPGVERPVPLSPPRRRTLRVG